ncbi:zinc finger protein ZAT10-like [Trifolium pratense]|uniref:Zinc finger protein ZAT10-like n=1 Tax=Trifolium pratense TaxID=57577 RepID=A0A2K3PH06_TRIPR|nr:zinc finger protein ZAT10-like [Trifolium pratense]
MKKSSSSSSSCSSCSSSSPVENDHDHALANVKQQGSNNHKCDLCNRVFTSGNALGGHKTAHRSHIFPTKKRYSCQLCNKVFSSIKALNGHMKWHSPKGSNGVVSSSLEQTSNCDGQETPAIDLSTYLPPILYRTKKRGRKIINDHEAVTPAQILLINDHEAVTASQILFDMSHSRVVYRGEFIDFDVDRSAEKRLKLSTNVDDTEKLDNVSEIDKPEVNDDN